MHLTRGLDTVIVVVSSRYNFHVFNPFLSAFISGSSRLMMCLCLIRQTERGLILVYISSIFNCVIKCMFCPSETYINAIMICHHHHH